LGEEGYLKLIQGNDITKLVAWLGFVGTNGTSVAHFNPLTVGKHGFSIVLMKPKGASFSALGPAILKALESYQPVNEL